MSGFKFPPVDAVADRARNARALVKQDHERHAEIAELDWLLAGQVDEEPEPPPAHIEDPSPTGYEIGFPFGF